MGKVDSRLPLRIGYVGLQGSVIMPPKSPPFTILQECITGFVDSPEKADMLLIDQRSAQPNPFKSHDNRKPTLSLISPSSTQTFRLGLGMILEDDGASRLRHEILTAFEGRVTGISHSFYSPAIKIVDVIDNVAKSAHLHQQDVYGLILQLRQLPELNDRLGRNCVDQMLSVLEAQYAAFLAEELEGLNVKTSMDGDRLTVICQGLQSRIGWQHLAEQLLLLTAEPMTLGDITHSPVARAALATLKNNEDAKSFIARLQDALDDIKQTPGMLMKWADRGTDAVTVRGRELERDLMGAIERDEIVIRFQPQFRMSDNALYGVEALSRWHHPEMGNLGAVTLFKVAQRADMMVRLSRHIQAKALSYAQQWSPALSHLRMAINLTAQDFAMPDFLEHFDNMLKNSRFPADRLTVEVTESALINDLSAASEKCTALQKLGVNIAIDDFGTGYSSLLYLKRLPVDMLKLDGAMSRDIAAEPRDQIIVRSVVAMSRALDLALVAEGVETEEQCRNLANEGVDVYQGFLSGRAMDPITFEEFALRAN